MMVMRCSVYGTDRSVGQLGRPTAGMRSHLMGSEAMRIGKVSEESRGQMCFDG